MTVSCAAPVDGGWLSQRSCPQSSTSGSTSSPITNFPGIARSSVVVALFGRQPIRLRSDRQALEPSRLLGEGDFRRQALHAGSAVEAVAAPTVLQDEAGVVGHGDRPA